MTGFLLDTNIISELIKPKPEVKVTSWLREVNEDFLYLSVLTLGEIRKGVSTLSDAKRRVSIEAWLEKDLRDRFSGRILSITEDIADRWGTLTGYAKTKNILVPTIDGLLAATAIHHHLVLVTRNTKDIFITGVNSFNPWDAK